MPPTDAFFHNFISTAIMTALIGCHIGTVTPTDAIPLSQFRAIGDGAHLTSSRVGSVFDTHAPVSR